MRSLSEPARPVRVLIMIGQLDRGGAERQVHELATRLDRALYDPTVVTFGRAGYYQPVLEEPGVRLVVVEKGGWREAAALFRLSSLMRELSTDVVHGFLFPANWRAVVAARMAGVRAVLCSVRSTGIWMNARHRWMDRIVLSHASVVVANAPAVASDIVDRVGLPSASVRVILNGVDTGLFHPKESSSRATPPGTAGDHGVVVGFIGSLRQAKDPILFVRAAAVAAGRLPSARFVIVGDGPLRSAVAAEAGRLGIGGKVTFLGERSDIPDLLRGLDLLAVTSEREGCCNVILEAMATGVPVVATRVGGNPDLIEHGRTGWLFAHGDPGGGGEGMVRLLAHDGSREQVRAEALARARTAFSIDTMVSRTAALYEEFL